MITQNQLVTVILPNYNHAVYLPERLDSIYNQTYQNFEVIILDDCSTDNSVSLLSDYRSHPKTTHFEVNTRNTGSPFKQWEKGINLAKGDVVWIAESDDYCDLNFLESQLIMMNEQQLDVAVAETKAVNNEIIIGRTIHPIFKHKEVLKITLDYFLYCPILNVSSTVFKKNLVTNKRQFFKYSLIGDRVFYFEAFQNKKIGLNRKTQSYFRKTNDSVSTLASKGLNYLVQYYHEHQHFALAAFRNDNIDIVLYRSYVARFFNRVNNRLSRKEKLNFKYLVLRLKYYSDLRKKR